MRTENLGNKKIELYDSIEDLPIRRFHKYNKMLLVDSGIGSDLSDFDAHITKAIAYAQSKTPQYAVIELQNLRQNVFMIHSELSPRFLAFACLVKSINGKECNDLSDDGLRKVVDELSDISVNVLTALLEVVKKKIEDELVMYFPKMFDNASTKELYDHLRRRTLLVLDSIIDGESNDLKAEIDKISILLLTYNKPQSFSGNDNAEVAHDKNFEKMCVYLSQHLHTDPKNYSVSEFYNAFEYVQEQIKEQIKASKRKI